MNIYVPQYYNSFKCIADKCKHTCCVGWEIEIDNDTFEFYKTLNGDLAKKLAECILIEDDIPHFVLDSDERCPFLNKNNLCDIITKLDDSALCQVCSDHPRFRNFFSNRTEIGLGLCCEEACRLILTNDKKTSMIPLIEENAGGFTDEEFEFFKLRNTLLEILQDRKTLLDERIRKIIDFMNIELRFKTFADWISIYLSFEQLNENWTKKLENALISKDVEANFENNYEIVFEQLMVYFIYRHLADGIYDNTLKVHVAFAVHATYMIKNLCRNSNSIDEIIDTARQYSSEIEYSDENIEKLLNLVCV